MFLSIHNLEIHIFPNSLIVEAPFCAQLAVVILSIKFVCLSVSPSRSPSLSHAPALRPPVGSASDSRPTKTPPSASPAMAAPDTTAVSIRALFGTMIGLITIAVCLRFFARRRQKANLRADDWLTIPVWVCRLPQCKVARQGVLQSN